MQSSPNTNNFTHIWTSRRQNDMTFGGWKEKTISNNFDKKTYSNSDGNNEILSRQKLKGYPPRPQQHYSVF
jgi:hypothetical protein